jgi:hypothetical protein
VVRPDPATISETEKHYLRDDFVFNARSLAIHETACEYRPRRPEESVLYSVVAGHLETFLAQQRERGRLVPRFVERELRSFLDCGVLANGFLHRHVGRLIERRSLGPMADPDDVERQLIPPIHLSTGVRTK